MDTYSHHDSYDWSYADNIAESESMGSHGSDAISRVTEGCGSGDGDGVVEGYGSGDGDGAVEGCGNGDGDRYVEGCGSGDVDGAVEGYGSGDGDGAVEGCGSGDGDGLLRGVAAETLMGLLRGVAVETMGLLRGVEVETMGLLRSMAVETVMGLLRGVAVETMMGLSVVRRIPMGRRMTLSFWSDVSLELRLRDISEDQKVEQFMSTGCCTKWKGKSCSLQFTKDYVKDVRLSCIELTTTELDLVIMGQLLACTNTSQRIITDVHHPVHYCRKHNYTNFLHRGSTICTGTFSFLHAVGAKRIKNIMTALKTNARIHEECLITHSH